MGRNENQVRTCSSSSNSRPESARSRGQANQPRENLHQLRSHQNRESLPSPILPDADGQVAALVEGILEKSEQLEAIEGALEIEKAELIAIAKSF